MEHLYSYQLQTYGIYNVFIGVNECYPKDSSSRVESVTSLKVGWVKTWFSSSIKTQIILAKYGKLNILLTLFHYSDVTTSIRNKANIQYYSFNGTFAITCSFYSDIQYLHESMLEPITSPISLKKHYSARKASALKPEKNIW